jgi:hypothetical protein
MNQNRRISILILGLTLSALAQTPSSAKLIAASPVADGVYIGLESIPSMSPRHPDVLWYNELTLVVENGDFVLDEQEISVQDGKREHSTMDDPSATYRGLFLSKQGQLYVSIRLFTGDPTLIPWGSPNCEPYSRVQILPLKLAENGFWMNGVLYKPSTLTEERWKSLKGLLKSQPLEYDGKHPQNKERRLPKCEVNDLSALDD